MRLTRNRRITTVDPVRRPIMLPVRPALFTLLGVNTLVYALNGRGTETVDAAAWFALLMLFEAETRLPQPVCSRRNAAIMMTLRLLAASAIAWAAITFVREREWLDAANAWLWIGVVFVLELEIRAPALIARYRSITVAASIILYLSLALVALLWLARGDWFDGYDALLWIAAFALLELDLLGRLPAKPAGGIREPGQAD